MKRSVRRFALFVLVFLILGYGCARNESAMKRDGSYASTATWIRAAQVHEHQGDLQQALYKYRIARTVSGQDPAVTGEIKRLQNRIALKTGKLAASAKQAQSERKYGRARSLYLEILSLEPKHREALAGLRQLDERNSKRKMRKKIALSRRNRTSKPAAKQSRGYDDEGYAYSRQAILQAESRAADVDAYIKELEKHVLKYPKDRELSSMLLNTRMVQARAAFQAETYQQSLHHLREAERVFGNEAEVLGKLSLARKEFAKALYLKGVRSVRSDRANAVKLWEAALMFDPEDKRTRLRIQNIDTM